MAGSIGIVITSLTGRLVRINGASAELEPVPAVRVEALVPGYYAERLVDSVGSTVTMRTRMHLESQAQGSSFIPRLLGFPDEADRAFFELFTSVKGVGARKALRAMAIEPTLIAASIAARDAKALTKLPEIGARVAETMVAELHGKVDRWSAGAPIVEARPGPVVSGPAEDAVETLIALGETRAEAERRISRAAAAIGEGATTEALVAGALGGG